jgi:sulfur carrier protein
MSSTDSVENNVEITVNGEPREVAQRYPLTDLLQEMDLDPENVSGVAVAINESVVRRSDWSDVRLSGGDAVEVITAQQGG